MCTLLSQHNSIQIAMAAVFALDAGVRALLKDLDLAEFAALLAIREGHAAPAGREPDPIVLKDLCILASAQGLKVNGSFAYAAELFDANDALPDDAKVFPLAGNVNAVVAP
jgi:hypothetical protein